MPRSSFARPIACAALVLAAAAGAGVRSSQAQDEQRRDVTITALDQGYEPVRIEVRQNEIVSVTFIAKDAPHSLNIDAYRVAKRAEPGVPVRFEFRAERAGRFPYYCNLTSASGKTHDMRGELVVRK